MGILRTIFLFFICILFSFSCNDEDHVQMTTYARKPSSGFDEIYRQPKGVKAQCVSFKKSDGNFQGYYYLPNQGEIRNQKVGLMIPKKGKVELFLKALFYGSVYEVGLRVSLYRNNKYHLLPVLIEKGQPYINRVAKFEKITFDVEANDRLFVFPIDSSYDMIVPYALIDVIVYLNDSL